jgi:hypothetical protein
MQGYVACLHDPLVMYNMRLLRPAKGRQAVTLLAMTTQSVCHCERSEAI